MDKLGVCNLALQLIGVSDRIEREDEDSLERQVCFDWYDIARERMLTAFPWNFADAYDWQPVNEPNDGQFPYMVKLDEDCLFVRSVTARNINPKGIDACLRVAENHLQPLRSLTRWCVADGVIYSLDPVDSYCYTLNRKDVDKFPAGKIQLLAYFLAESIAPALQRNSDITVRMAQLRQSYLQTNINEDVAQLRDWAS